MRGWRIALMAGGLALISTSPAPAQDRSQGRSMIISQYGIVAAEQPIGTRAGTAILERGGNAIDAAVAANAAMGLVAPMMNGIGGDLFAIVYEAKSGKIYGLNASGWAPRGLSIEFLRSKQINRMPFVGIHSATVPGAVAGWDALLQRLGTKSLAEVLAPAVAASRDGFPVTEIFAAHWSHSTPVIREDAVAAKLFLPGGRSPRVGDMFRNPELANSLEEIGRGGKDAFYKGALAKRILATSAKHGGTLAADDLAEFAPEWVDPISTKYHDWTVYEMPPSEQGIAALMMLNMMETFPIALWGHNSVRALHTMIEAKKLAYADMITYVADPRFAKVPVAGMISRDYGRERAALIDPARANCSVGPGRPPYTGSDTIYLATVDRDGNMVSLIQSNYGLFGSGVGVEGGGFVLHNRGALFNLDPKHPNALAGRKRPLHTIIPALMTNGNTRIAFGIMGGFNQAQAHAQFVSNVVDFRMNIQAAMEAARFTKPSFAGCDLQIEQRVPLDVRNALTAMGHQLYVHGDYTTAMGGGQAVMRDYTAGINYGASDPRKDGAAMAEMAVGR
jgi:gamma-glutamyltranspeptidase/glutathione hydrolase